MPVLLLRYGPGSDEKGMPCVVEAPAGSGKGCCQKGSAACRMGSRKFRGRKGFRYGDQAAQA